MNAASVSFLVLMPYTCTLLLAPCNMQEYLKARILSLRQLNFGGVPVIVFCTVEGFTVRCPHSPVAVTATFPEAAGMRLLTREENPRLLRLQVWDPALATCYFTQKIQVKSSSPTEGSYCQGISTVACKDGTMLLCIGGSDGSLHIYQPQDNLAFTQVRCLSVRVTFLLEFTQLAEPGAMACLRCIGRPCPHTDAVPSGWFRRGTVLYSVQAECWVAPLP